ncbi:hypothetical protein BGW38_010255, partial [Lunasporangiospora selenospora]
KILREWDLHFRILYGTTDSGANIKRAVSDLGGMQCQDLSTFFRSSSAASVSSSSKLDQSSGPRRCVSHPLSNPLEFQIRYGESSGKTSSGN